MNDERQRDAARMSELLGESDCGELDAATLSDSLRWPFECNVVAWSARVLERAAAELEAQAYRVWRRQTAVFVGLAAAAVPVTLLTGAVAARLLFDFLCSVIPPSLATYIVWTYVTAAFGVVGATLATIPVLVGRSYDQLALHSFASPSDPSS